MKRWFLRSRRRNIDKGRAIAKIVRIVQRSRLSLGGSRSAEAVLVALADGGLAKDDEEDCAEAKVE